MFNKHKTLKIFTSCVEITQTPYPLNYSNTLESVIILLVIFIIIFCEIKLKLNNL